jgi:predicted MFS family arabinose efflux permease
MRLAGLWRNVNFTKLWFAQTVSELGSKMGALGFVAVLALGASPFQMGWLGTFRLLPALMFGLVAEVWVDRLPRRPILIVADFGSAALLASIAIAWAIDRLTIEHLYVVTFGTGLSSVFFGVAYRSYLPSLVPRDDLIEATSKLLTSEAVVETTGFSAGGWIAQILGSITVVVFDTITFLVSGIAFLTIRKHEPVPEKTSERRSIRREIVEGLRFVWEDGILRAIAGSTILTGIGTGMAFTLWLLFGVEELGIQPGVLGTIAAVGGVTSLGGAVYAERITKKFGIGPTMVVTQALATVSFFLIPAASGPIFIAATFLVINQFGDAPEIIYLINKTNLSQAITPGNMLGRVNASSDVVGLIVLAAVPVLKTTELPDAVEERS